MAKKVKSAKSDIGSDLSPVILTPSFFGTKPSTLPFPEWSDHDVSNERWDSNKTSIKTPSLSTVPLFEDPQENYLPSSIVAHEWKRPSEIYPNAQFTIFVNNPVYPDLISGSKHLLHSEFVRSFISSIEILLYLGNTRRFTVEYISSSFTPNTDEFPWRPWHHIYSNCKAGKGQDHAPTINEEGKYIVRLFWMGCWRKICVDDLIPVDMLNHVLLPSLELTKEEAENKAFSMQIYNRVEQFGYFEVKTEKTKKTEERKVIEIWPFILSKALMKLASLSWYEEKEVVDFDIIQCLTGWIPQKIITKELNISDIWDICSAYTDHFTWPMDKSEASTKTTKDSKKGKKAAKGIDKKASKKSMAGVEKDSDDGYNAHHLLVCCNDLRRHAEDEILDITPCWSHYLLIDQTRDIPLMKPTLTADLAFWKKFRWLAWAIRNGMVSSEEGMDQIKCFKVVSPFKKVFHHVVYKQPSKISITIEKSVAVINELDKEAKKSKKDKGKGGKEKKEKGSSKEEKGSKKSKGSGKSKNSGKSKESGKSKGKKKVDLSLIPDPSIWIDYEKLSYQINTIVIYLKPSKFKSKVKISDIAATSEPLKDKTRTSSKRDMLTRDAAVTPNWKSITLPKETQEYRNEPIYIFADSVDYKLLVINIMQTGYTKILEREVEVKKEVPRVMLDEITECDFCFGDLIKRVKRNVSGLEEKEYVALAPTKQKILKYKRILSNLVLEKFNWQKETIGEMISSVNTYGSKTTILDLEPGRRVLRLWIKSENSYVTQILSDTEVVVGCLEEILIAMAKESQLLINMGYEIASTFGKLVQAFGMPEFLIQLRSFCNSYKPNINLTKKESFTLHDTFYNLIYSKAEEVCSTDELNAIKTLFFKWDLPKQYTFEEEEPEICNCYDDENLKYVKIMERSLMTIQAFFRSFYVRCLMKRHKQTHKNHFNIFENLKNVYNLIFSAEKRVTTCPYLVRMFLKHPNLDEIKHKYAITFDMENVISLEQIVQSSKVYEKDWALICRQPFYINSSKPITVKINLFCDIEKYVIRVFDNDSNKEIERYTKNVTVSEYSRNLRGYTILCYGWSNEKKQLHYKLCLAVKKERNDKIIVPHTSVQINVLKGNYIPNTNNYISKYLVNVHSNNVLLTARLITCYENTVINLKLLDGFGQILQEVTGKTSVILPAVVLDFCPKDLGHKAYSNSSLMIKNSTLQVKPHERRSKKSTKSLSRTSDNFKRSIDTENGSREISQYVIEVTLLDDTWPLNAKEWKHVNDLKTDMLYGLNYFNDTVSNESDLSSKKSSDSVTKFVPSKSLSNKNSDTVVIQSPYWILQTIYDYSDLVQISVDKRREEEINSIKQTWYEMDPRRYKISKKLRDKYLEENRIDNVNVPDEDSEERNLDPNYFASEILPSYDLSVYMTKDPEEIDECEIKLMTEDDFEEVEENERYILEEYENNQCLHDEEMENSIEEQKDEFETLNNWFGECRAESAEMMSYALNLRNQYITNVLESINKKSSKKKDKGKGAKGKKK